MPSSNKGVFYYVLALTAFFFVFEIAVKVGSLGFGFSDFHTVFTKLGISVLALQGLSFFLVVQLFLHLLFVFFVWGSVCSITVYFPQARKFIDNITLVVWFATVMALLIANQVFYPNSAFAKLTGVFFNSTIAVMLLYVLLLLLFFISIALLADIIRYFNSYRYALFTIMTMTVVAVIYGYKHDSLRKPVVFDQPNIIIIGFDSLRPDFLGFFGGEAVTPVIDDFLAESTIFTQAYTSIARTYPSWISILTGEYPKNLNVRYNLSAQLDFDLEQTLPAILRRHGYHTVYAVDESRFSNIDTRFGFDDIVVPPMGLNDFLIGTINDFPVSNWLVNSRFGEYVFPYSYANRPAYVTYDPRSFTKKIEKTLQAAPKKPLFLAVHFCLTHFPYVSYKEKITDKYLDLYRQSIDRSDMELKAFFSILKKNHLLDNTIVVLLSDHGEGLWLPGDRVTEERYFVAGKKAAIPSFFPKGKETEQANESVGHGTDVLGLVQYHTLLAFQYFGISGQLPKKIDHRVSVMDIMPTLLNYLSIDPPIISGKSLLSYVSGKVSAPEKPTDFFMETDFTPAAIRSVYPNVKDVARQGIDYFEVNPATGRLSIAKNMGEMIISTKQYADLYGDWILALYPKNKSEMIPILVNTSSGYWTNDLSTPFAMNAPVAHMLSALRQFYGNEIKEIQEITS